MPYRPNFPIPEDIYAEPFCLCIQVPNDPTWKQVVAGLLDELNQWYNWQRDEEKSGKDCAQVWRGLYEQIDWTTMSCCCDNPPAMFRYTSDGTLQRSTDGGTTWTDEPGYDPRNNSTVFPPVEGDEINTKKCIAADGMKNAIKDQVGGQLTDDMTRYTLGQLINDWVNIYIQTSNPFQALMTIVANQIFALIIAVLRPALTDEVYDTLQCIFYCYMKDDLSFSQSDVDIVRGKITDQISGIAGTFFEHLVYLLGAVGMTNLARSQYSTTGDCTDCDCPDQCISGWTAGYNYAGSNYPFGSIIDTDADWIIVQSADRGDGTQTIRITQPPTGWHDCNVFWEQLDGGTIWSKAFCVSPTAPSYESATTNPLMGTPVVANYLEFLDGTGSPFTMKFTFAPPP